MSFFKNKNNGNGDVSIEMSKDNTAIQPNEPTDATKIFWIDSDE